MANHPYTLGLENKYVPVCFMGEEITARIYFTQPFLLGHRSAIDLGWILIEDMTKFLLREDRIEMKFLDSEKIKISEYIDILGNPCGLHGKH